MSKTITTRIKNKVDNYTNWHSSTGILLNGEIAIVRVPTGDTYTNPVTGKSEPVVELLMKVGDGSSTFDALPWLSAKASDVYSWAKKGTAEEVPVTINGTASTLGTYLTQVNTNTSNISSVSAKVDVDKVSTAISNAINALDYSSSSTDTSTSKIAFVTAVTQTNGKIAVKKRNIIEADLPDISASKIKVDSSTTLTSKLDTMDAAIAANTSKLAGHTDAAINTLIDTKINALDVDEPSASGTSTSFIKTAKQENGKIVVTKASLPTASASAAGITKLYTSVGTSTDGTVTRKVVNDINTQVNTNKADIANLKTAVAGGVHFRGTVTAEPSATTTTVDDITIAAGDVVIYSGKEYICTAVTDGKPSWEQLGDVTRIGNLETKINNLAVADTAVAKQFVTAVSQTDGKISVSRAQPTSADVSHGDSTVAKKFEAVDAAIAAKADSGHTHSSYVNQNAFSKIAVSGQTTVEADTVTDTVTFAGSNVSITTDATNDKVTFTVADGSTSTKGIVKLSSAIDSTSEVLAATPKAVKSAYDLATEAKADAAEAATLAGHSHPYLPDTTMWAKGATQGGAAVSANKVNKAVTFNNSGSGADSGTTFDGSTARTISYNTIGAAASNHTHSAHEARTSAIEGNYVRVDKVDNIDTLVWVNTSGVDEIILDCGGAPV